MLVLSVQQNDLVIYTDSFPNFVLLLQDSIVHCTI